MTDSQQQQLEQVLAQRVFSGTANVPFGEMTRDQIQERADELGSAVGWGPTARVAGVASAWRELAMAMERSEAGKVSDLDPEVVLEFAPRLWVVPPGGTLLQSS
jgi:hypothetical protein